MKKVLIAFWISLFLLFDSLSAQDSKFVVRVGVSGIGTSDEGLWYFKESQNIGPQPFIFRNSWGGAVDIDYLLSNSIAFGLHSTLTRTSFSLDVHDSGNLYRTNEHTSHNQLIIEAKYITRPKKAFRPFLGLNAGKLYTRDIHIDYRSENLEFEFINPFIFGLVLGFDYDIGINGWGIHFIVRGQSFEYTTEETSVTERQTLLDQVWWMNFNHIQLGIGKKF